MEKISVIIPAYNCEKYLEQCVRSVLAQIYQNLEIIIVNDGSTDTTGKIMEQLAQEDKRIKTLHKENTGVGETRNVGLSLATGDYICFIDSEGFHYCSQIVSCTGNYNLIDSYILHFRYRLTASHIAYGIIPSFLQDFN